MDCIFFSANWVKLIQDFANQPYGPWQTEFHLQGLCFGCTSLQAVLYVHKSRLKCLKATDFNGKRQGPVVQVLWIPTLRSSKSSHVSIIRPWRLYTKPVYTHFCVVLCEEARKFFGPIHQISEHTHNFIYIFTCMYTYIYIKYIC